MDKEDLNNFRPITYLSFLSKVIERTVACQTRHYLAVNDLYPKLPSSLPTVSERRNGVATGPQWYLNPIRPGRRGGGGKCLR